jgi:hypothetical protein
MVVRHRHEQMNRFQLIASTILALAVPGAIQREPIVIGVLEQPQCAGGSAQAVRPLFRKDGPAWVPLATPQAAHTASGSRFEWTVVFDGRSIGRLTSVDTGFHGAPEWTYPRDHRQQLAPRQSVPRVPNRARAFEGWCDAPRTRPLVVVSQPNFRDPQRWKPFVPDQTERQAFFARFRAVVDTVLVCPSEGERPRPWRFGPGDLVAGRSYADKLSRKLLALRLNPAANTCDGPSGAEWSLQWFYVAQDTVYLGAQMELVDAGDYDADGQSEVLFWVSAYNEDGYSLFFDGLRRHADFRWSYH